jgi:DNA-binding CsgD family transcriptional regulator
VESAGFSTLLLDLYEAAASPGGWERVAPLVAQEFGVESCQIQYRSPDGRFVQRLSRTPNYTDKLLNLYATSAWRDDVWSSYGASHPNLLTRNENFISDAGVLALDYYNEVMRPLDIFYVMGTGATLGRDGGIGLLGIHRSHKEGTFSADDERRMNLFLPHFQRAMSLTRRLRDVELQRDAGMASLDALSLGLVLAGADGKIFFANSIAERHLQAGAAIKAMRGHLCVCDARNHEILKQSIRNVAALAYGKTVPSPPLIMLRGSEEARLSLLVCPAPTARHFSGPDVPVVAIYIGEPDRKPVSLRDLVTRVYGLTPAEGRLLSALLDGERLQETADRLEISVNTIRTQLRSLFAKTGHRRQSDLIREVTNHPVLRLAAGKI